MHTIHVDLTEWGREREALRPAPESVTYTESGGGGEPLRETVTGPEDWNKPVEYALNIVNGFYPNVVIQGKGRSMVVGASSEILHGYFPDTKIDPEKIESPWLRLGIGLGLVTADNIDFDALLNAAAGSVEPERFGERQDVNEGGESDREQ